MEQGNLKEVGLPLDGWSFERFSYVGYVEIF
jgi:hypothetical protein